MEKTLAVINQLEKEGIIGCYAIGGAVAATRYVEPVSERERVIGVAHATNLSRHFQDTIRQSTAKTGTCSIILGRESSNH